MWVHGDLEIVVFSWSPSRLRRWGALLVLGVLALGLGLVQLDQLRTSDQTHAALEQSQLERERSLGRLSALLALLEGEDVPDERTRRAQGLYDRLHASVADLEHRDSQEARRLREQLNRRSESEAWALVSFLVVLSMMGLVALTVTGRFGRREGHGPTDSGAGAPRATGPPNHGVPESPLQPPRAEKYRAVLELAREGVVIHRGSKLIYANPAASRLLRLDADAAAWSRVYTSKGACCEGECHARRLSVQWEREGERWLDVITQRVSWEGQRMLHSSITDVTEQVRAEQVAKTQLEAEAEAQSKSQMLANMSHELRTPMTGVLGMADLLLQTHHSSEQHRLLTGLRSSADLLLSLLNDVLDFSKLEANALRLEQIDFDLRQAVTTVVQLLDPKAYEKGLVLHCSIDEEVPMAVRGDPARLQQILFNLIGNAIKFTDHGHVQIRVTGRARSGIADLRFEVNDTGIGVSADRIPYLFQRFEQGDPSTHRRFGGTGLGLAICKRLTEMMGGAIGLESEPERGSSFHVELELPVGDASWVAAPPQADTRLRLGWAQGRSLLLAEDQEVNRLMLTMLMEGEGFDVVAVENGAEAVDAARAQRFDIVVMDMHMPVMSGAEATRAIHRLPDGRPPIIIGLTADAVVERRRQYMDVGLDAFLTKPFERNQFAALAFELLEKRGPAAPVPRSASARPSSREALDVKRLEHLRSSVGVRNLDKLLEKFSVQARDEAERLEQALLSGETTDIRYRAHRLAGFAGNFGAVRLAQWAHRVEGDVPVDPMPALDELNRLIEQAVHAVEVWQVAQQTAPDEAVL
ncbi:MAG: ATP-binding protein [Myxococcota bacterium]